MIQNNNKEKVGGFNCPACRNFIPTSMEELVTSTKLSCPVCKLELSIDRAHSQQAMSAMSQVLDAQKNLDDASHFGRR